MIQHEFLENLGIFLERIDAQTEFLEALRGVTDEKRKAKIVSERMIQVLARQINDDPEVQTVVLGTNFNDVLFGQTPVAALQNATAERQPIYLQPLQNLFKDEVRACGLELALLERMLDRYGDRIDFVWLGEDLGTQHTPMIMGTLGSRLL